MRMRKAFSRAQFERLIDGEWVKMQGGRYRQNGAFWTASGKKWKLVSDGSAVIRAKTWKELAIALKLV